jgi:hypothetical protein
MKKVVLFFAAIFLLSGSTAVFAHLPVARVLEVSEGRTFHRNIEARTWKDTQPNQIFLHWVVMPHPHPHPPKHRDHRHDYNR